MIKKCGICGKEFETKSKAQKYCTAECYGVSAYNLRKKYQAEKKAKNQRICHICKQPLPPFIQKICTDCLLKDFKCNGFSQFTSTRLRGRGYKTKEEINRLITWYKEVTEFDEKSYNALCRLENRRPHFPQWEES